MEQFDMKNIFGIKVIFKIVFFVTCFTTAIHADINSEISIYFDKIEREIGTAESGKTFVTLKQKIETYTDPNDAFLMAVAEEAVNRISTDKGSKEARDRYFQIFQICKLRKELSALQLIWLKGLVSIPIEGMGIRVRAAATLADSENSFEPDLRKTLKEFSFANVNNGYATKFGVNSARA